MAEHELQDRSVETRLILDSDGNETGKIVTEDRVNGPSLIQSITYRQSWVEGIVDSEVVYDKYIESLVNPFFSISRAIAMRRATMAVKKYQH